MEKLSAGAVSIEDVAVTVATISSQRRLRSDDLVKILRPVPDVETARIRAHLAHESTRCASGTPSTFCVARSNARRGAARPRASARPPEPLVA